jgi:uncharacterized phage-associated protein
MSSFVPYDSVIVAKYIIYRASENKRVVNVTKVQKLLYIAYGLMLADKGERLIDESPQAWPFGPVFPRSQNQKKVNYSVIPQKDDPELSNIIKDDTSRYYIDTAIDEFGGLTASRLSDWSHETGSPWDETVKQKGFNWGMPISDELIKNFFKQFILNGE